MSTFSERKRLRKQKKYENILFKEWKLNISGVPSKHLMICNAGLLSGISEADMVCFFSRFGEVEEVCMVPSKSYSFVSFCELSSAELCVSRVSDSVNPECFDKVAELYLLYIEGLPKVGNVYRDNEVLPPGLIIVNDFLSELEESMLVNCTKIMETDCANIMKHRTVRHYGYAFEYGINNVDKNKPLEEKIPKEFEFLQNRFSEKGVANVIKWFPDQLTVNMYRPGQGIPPHVDTHSAFEDPILSLSLLSDIVMEFEKCDKTKKTSVVIPRRSLLIMSGEARYFWTHGITPRKSDVSRTPHGLTVKHREIRVSCTFRKIRDGKCDCNYHSVCDSFIKSNFKIPLDKHAVKIESDYVHKVYDSISDHFSLTRHTPWPRVQEFIKSLPTGSVLLDIGCGNGKYFNLNKDIFHFGGDSCAKLTSICKEQGEVLRFNCLSLPVCDNIVDAVICIAVLHHLSTESRRLQVLEEIYRVLRPHGRALIYVWAMEQKSSNYVSKKNSDIGHSTVDEGVTNSLPGTPPAAFINDTDILPIHSNRTEFQHNDVLVPWNIRLKNREDSCHLRYYHVFKEKELDDLCTKLGATVEDSYYDDGNWCIKIQKIPDHGLM